MIYKLLEDIRILDGTEEQVPLLMRSYIELAREGNLETCLGRTVLETKIGDDLLQEW